MEKNLKAVADAFSAENNFVVESTSEWVKVYDKFLWDNLVAYIVYDEESEEYAYYIHIPAEWNGVIEGANFSDLADFNGEVSCKVSELNGNGELPF